MTATLDAVVRVTKGRIALGQADAAQAFSSMSLDSAAVEPGGLFAALPGTRVHGASFAENTEAGAILTDEHGVEILKAAGETRPVIEVADVRDVLGYAAAEVYEHPSEKLTVLGITGTSGKTTTSYLVEAGLLAAGYSVGLIGTTGTRINGQPVPTSLTTPEAPMLQALFARMVAEGVTHVVMEVSSHALALRRVQGTRFAVGAFSNLSQDHLDFHPTMQDYFDTKALFFRPDSSLRAEKVVVCVDDDWGQRMAQVAGEYPLTVSTRGHQALVQAHDVEVDSQGVQTFRLDLEGASLDVRLPLPGRFNVANAAVAVAIAHAAGVDVEVFARALATVAVPGRMERVDAGQEYIAVVDYAHKPAAIAEVLDTLRGQVAGRIGIAVGAGGNRDHSKRPIMGAEAARRADFVVITDDNPRDEDPAPIRAAVLDGAREAAQEREPAPEIVEVGDRRQAIAALAGWARPGDAIVVAGKGHENGQLVRGVNHPFDDREELRRAVEKTAGTER
ncbi:MULTISPECIES: UDP-N-acetylmuramoyl-L-alanyl-D-glutamate--2,6-diaminopimelate ligase [unclassified Corynebacterium]|uniref:UDP-N-acetylmuramoyl-L-alanyl-D-glutamate--2, 6-diaminopimelate ligase n=1 Tax=unclassified Corynebacterium TaxID=2624378 RepID=UPI0029CA3C4E|nr:MULTISPECIES: UDP-N-acetylmuramoyl-L-alanyl-D-glutamate--2,6-diaminopimelate ligase [unclassified Corynebacterium]WPF65446.1 UDP-N-acetylmuramoyl-L-alanyl-D-glutamate--2,6-diaminopimelate ligase [Corynebacterium sp. 22KM0430]WPF67942.1 UDP-N-acetylmuramoyl-L-alanyl-D-glutamate--2,6-diaminopimelate ligase [Corynebacterium sp. 21KM1197]